MIPESGDFYKGGVLERESGERTAEPLILPSHHLTTHGVILGMTGSGKTGLGVVLLEEALLSGIPTLVLDPKGDMGNLLLGRRDRRARRSTGRGSGQNRERGRGTRRHDGTDKDRPRKDGYLCVGDGTPVDPSEPVGENMKDFSHGRPWMTRSIVVTLCAVGSLLWAGATSAQTLRGHILDAGSGIPVATALLIALDENGSLGGRTLTNRDGSFELRLATSFELDGLRVDRIGYGSQVLPAEDLDSAGPTTLRIASVPIELEGIGAAGENLCGAEFENSGQVQTIWLEVRKALEMTRLSQTERVSRFETERVERSLDPDNLSELDRRITPRELRGERPYRSLTGPEMTENGWAEPADDGGLIFYAPDASALLSDEFSSQHCFGAEFTDENILLHFTPNRSRRSLPEIEGELILDRETYELALLRYEYTSLPLPGSARATGEVHFSAVPTGVWVVSEWWIRMPLLARVQQRWPGGSFERIDVREIREEGGRVLSVDTGSEVFELTSPSTTR